MLIKEAQREIRSAFLGGFVGQLVAGIIWALSAAVGTWVAPRLGMAVLFFVSMLLFPLTQLILKLIGRPAKLSAENTLGQLATQIAFTVPIGFVLVGAATLYRENWFYPAGMIVVGAHYLPFIFLYGMPQFGILALAQRTSPGLSIPGERGGVSHGSKRETIERLEKMSSQGIPSRDTAGPSQGGKPSG